MVITTIIESVSNRGKLTNGIAYTTNILFSPTCGCGNIDV